MKNKIKYIFTIMVSLGLLGCSNSYADHDVGVLFTNSTAPLETILTNFENGVELVYSNEGYVFVKNTSHLTYDIGYTIDVSNTQALGYIPYMASQLITIPAGTNSYFTVNGQYNSAYTPVVFNAKLILKDITIMSPITGNYFRCDMNNQVVRDKKDGVLQNAILASCFTMEQNGVREYISNFILTSPKA